MPRKLPRSTLRAWIDDHHPIFRRGLATSMTAAGIEVVGESEEFRPYPKLGGVDVLLFDADLTGLRAALPLVDEIKVVALFRQVDEDLMWAAFNGGVAGILMHEELQPRLLTDTIRSAVSGSMSMPHDLVPHLIERAARSPRSPVTGYLAGRELDVLRLLAEGEGTKSIADTLAYSERTVKNVIRDVLVKLNCRNRAHAVATATRHGVI